MRLLPLISLVAVLLETVTSYAQTPTDALPPPPPAPPSPADGALPSLPEPARPILPEAAPADNPAPAHAITSVGSGPGAPPKQTVRLRLDTTNLNVALSEHIGAQTPGGHPWRQLCIAPCDMDVDAGGTYRISGTDVMKSLPFRLPQDAGRVTVKVDAKTDQDKTWAWVLTAGGGILIANGALLYFAGSQTETVENNVDGQHGMDSGNVGGTFKTLGLVAVGVGAIAGVMGLVRLSAGLDSTVEVIPDRGTPGGARVSLGRGIQLDMSGLRF